MTHSQNGTFYLSGFLSFLIKYTSEQYIVLVFMILSALLIWFLSTEMLVNVVLFVFFVVVFVCLFVLFLFFCCFFCLFFLLENH